MLARRTFKIAPLSLTLDRFAILILIGFVARALATLVAARLEEPGAQTLRQLFTTSR